ncbi:MAG: hypothetical protein WCA15_09105 [Candidatus Acidiferrales bacterium]
MRDSKEENFGFNAESGPFGDMIQSGVIDPAKVTRLAPRNAALIVALMLTTEVLIADIKEDEETPAVGAAHGGMGGMY